MIAQLRGTVVTAGLGTLVLDVTGIGYLVHVAPGSFNARPGDELTVHTHLAVREDALTLYGFPQAPAKDLFETLLGVTGVGPKLALAAIGTLGTEGLRKAVVGEDVAALTVIPGVGRKGAQRMILELRERLGGLDTDDMPGGDGHPASTDARHEVREALAALGYGAAEIRRAFDDVDAADASPEELLRTALRSLGKTG